MEVSITEQALDRRSRIIIGLIALAQGIALYLVIEGNIWPKDDWTTHSILRTFFVIVPTAIILSYRSNYSPKVYWTCLTLFAALFVWIPWFGSQRINKANLFDEYFFFVALAFFLAFIFLFFLKSYLREGRWLPSYESLFGFSWHNFLSFSLSYVFAFIFWGVLVLWGALFKIVEINFFHKLFREEWFLYPVLSLAFAYAVVMFRTKINAVGAVQRILRTLISLLLPLLLGIAVMFVAVLPFTGVNLIWSKGYGSDTIIGFVSLSLFFFNAVYQDAKEAPYQPLLNKVVQYSIIVLIVLLALAAYGVSLRVVQYGLTVERLFGIILIVVMSCYVVLYTFIIVIKSLNWALYFGKTNTFMALFVALIIVLMFTPVLDLSSMSVRSQLARLDQGKLTLENFDYHFLARNGTVGIEALQELKARPEVASSEVIVARIDKAIKSKGRRYYSPQTISRKELKSILNTYPIGIELDESIWAHFESRPYRVSQCFKSTCALLQVDLNSDAENEYILFTGNAKSVNFRFFIKDSKGQLTERHSYRNLSMSFEVLTQMLNNNSFSLVEPQWQDLKIGDQTIHAPSNVY